MIDYRRIYFYDYWMKIAWTNILSKSQCTNKWTFCYSGNGFFLSPTMDFLLIQHSPSLNSPVLHGQVIYHPILTTSASVLKSCIASIRCVKYLHMQNKFFGIKIKLLKSTQGEIALKWIIAVPIRARKLHSAVKEMSKLSHRLLVFFSKYPWKFLQFSFNLFSFFLNFWRFYLKFLYTYFLKIII